MTGPTPKAKLEDIVAGLARAQERHGKRIETQKELIEDLGKTVVELGRKIAASQTSAEADPNAVPRVCWMTLEDPEVALVVLADLVEWLEQVWCRYPGGSLPVCWIFHPWVIEELLGARHAHADAYGEKAKPTAVTEWHERIRPPLAARIGKELSTCLPERHTNPEVVTVPLAGAAWRLAPIWATTVHPRAMPAPTSSELAEAATHKARTLRARTEHATAV